MPAGMGWAIVTSLLVQNGLMVRAVKARLGVSTLASLHLRRLLEDIEVLRASKELPRR